MSNYSKISTVFVIYKNLISISNISTLLKSNDFVLCISIPNKQCNLQALDNQSIGIASIVHSKMEILHLDCVCFHTFRSSIGPLQVSTQASMNFSSLDKKCRIVLNFYISKCCIRMVLGLREYRLLFTFDFLV